MNTKDSTGIQNQGNAQKVRIIQPSKISYKNNQLQVENTFLIKKTQVKRANELITVYGGVGRTQTAAVMSAYSN